MAGGFTSLGVGFEGASGAGLRSAASLDELRSLLSNPPSVLFVSIVLVGRGRDTERGLTRRGRWL